MRKINPKCTNIDSFKYSILTSKLDAYANNYNFSGFNPDIFDKN